MPLDSVSSVLLGAGPGSPPRDAHSFSRCPRGPPAVRFLPYPGLSAVLFPQVVQDGAERGVFRRGELRAVPVHCLDRRVPGPVCDQRVILFEVRVHDGRLPVDERFAVLGPDDCELGAVGEGLALSLVRDRGRDPERHLRPGRLAAGQRHLVDVRVLAVPGQRGPCRRCPVRERRGLRGVAPLPGGEEPVGRGLDLRGLHRACCEGLRRAIGCAVLARRVAAVHAVPGEPRTAHDHRDHPADHGGVRSAARGAPSLAHKSSAVPRSPGSSPEAPP